LRLDKITEATEGKDFEIEDFISPEVYHRAVEAAYPNITVGAPEQSDGKRTKAYEKKFKEDHNLGFAKRRVAEQVKQMLLDGRSDDATDKNIAAITNALLSALDSQVGKIETRAEGRKTPVPGQPREKRQDKGSVPPAEATDKDKQA